MKAITIHQPWATLIATGQKHFETRSWSTDHRGMIAIHASKNEEYLQEVEYPMLANFSKSIREYPLGAVVALAIIKDVWRVEELLDRGMISEMEKNLGDYSRGRFAWEFKLVRQIIPIPARGLQRLWNWNHPDPHFHFN